jgi:alpha-tubulin suppressor-like RCC1 family protein
LYFQLGGFTKTDTNTPQKLLFQNFDIVQIAAGNEWTMILNRDGTVYSIGNNQNGRLGIGLSTSTSQFLPISEFNSNITKISAQFDFGIALRNKTMIGWGNNAVMIFIFLNG